MAPTLALVTSMRPLRALALLTLAAGATAAGTARAEPSSEDKALATTLFKEGRELMDAGKVSEGCRKLDESQRLDPGGGTLLNLAVCHEKEGRIASAWAEFTEALALARHDGRPERAQLASDRLAAIEPRLSRLTVIVPPAADRPDLQLTRDGSPLRRGAWGTPMPLDGGDHVIEATAPGKKTWSAHVKVAPEGDKQTLTLGVLDDAAAAPTIVAPPAAPVAPPPAAPAPVAPPPAPDGSGQRTAGYVVGGIGIASIGVGSYFGLRAISKRKQSDDLCSPRCTSEGETLNGQAGTSADVSTVTMAVGAAAVAVGAYLLISAPSARSAGSARIVPSAGPHGWGMSLHASF